MTVHAESNRGPGQPTKADQGRLAIQHNRGYRVGPLVATTTESFQTLVFGEVFDLRAKCGSAALGGTELATIDLHKAGLFAFGDHFTGSRVAK